VGVVVSSCIYILCLYSGLMYGLVVLAIVLSIVGYLFMINEIPKRLFRLLSKVISDQSRTVGK